MMEASLLERTLCKNFCDSITVNRTGGGFAISLSFKDRSGDLIGIYLMDDGNGGFHLEDSGRYLAELHAKGMDINRGERENLLDSILRESGAYWDRDTFDIKSSIFSAGEVASRVLSFMSALIRVRDVEFLTKDMIRSTFKEDAYNAIEKKFRAVANIEEGKPVTKKLGDYLPDITIESKANSSMKLAIYLANSAVSFQEAELLHAQVERENLSNNIRIVALIEDTDKLPVIGMHRFQRAQNRGLTMPIFRNDEEDSIDLIYKKEFSQLLRAV